MDPVGKTIVCRVCSTTYTVTAEDLQAWTAHYGRKPMPEVYPGDRGTTTKTVAMRRMLNQIGRLHGWTSTDNHVAGLRTCPDCKDKHVKRPILGDEAKFHAAMDYLESQGVHTKRYPDSQDRYKRPQHPMVLTRQNISTPYDANGKQVGKMTLRFRYQAMEPSTEQRQADLAKVVDLLASRGISATAEDVYGQYQVVI